MAKIVGTYTVEGFFIQKKGVIRNTGLVNLYDNGKIIGDVIENENRGIILGVRT